MWIASLQQVVESHPSKFWYMIDAVCCLPFMPDLICFDTTLALPCSTFVSQDLSSQILFFEITTMYHAENLLSVS